MARLRKHDKTNTYITLLIFLLVIGGFMFILLTNNNTNYESDKKLQGLKLLKNNLEDNLIANNRESSIWGWVRESITNQLFTIQGEKEGCAVYPSLTTSMTISEDDVMRMNEIKWKSGSKIKDNNYISKVSSNQIRGKWNIYNKDYTFLLEKKSSYNSFFFEKKVGKYYLEFYECPTTTLSHKSDVTIDGYKHGDQICDHGTKVSIVLFNNPKDVSKGYTYQELFECKLGQSCANSGNCEGENTDFVRETNSEDGTKVIQYSNWGGIIEEYYQMIGSQIRNRELFLSKGLTFITCYKLNDKGIIETTTASGTNPFCPKDYSKEIPTSKELTCYKLNTNNCEVESFTYINTICPKGYSETKISNTLIKDCNINQNQNHTTNSFLVNNNNKNVGVLNCYKIDIENECSILEKSITSNKCDEGWTSNEISKETARDLCFGSNKTTNIECYYCNTQNGEIQSLSLGQTECPSKLSETKEIECEKSIIPTLINDTSNICEDYQTYNIEENKCEFKTTKIITTNGFMDYIKLNPLTSASIFVVLLLMGYLFYPTIFKGGKRK